MEDRNEKQMRRMRERDKAIRMAQRRRDKLEARVREETFCDGDLTDRGFAYPAQKDRNNFVNSANGNNFRNKI